MRNKRATATAFLMILGCLANLIVSAPAQAAARSTKAAPTAAQRAATLSAADTQTVALIDSVLATLRAGAPTGAAPGTWKGSGGCWRCDAGPALALAAAAAVAEDPVRRAEAERILDFELTTHRQANGAFGTTSAGSDIDTMFFANVLGVSAILLKSTMTRARYTRWSTAVAGAADFLIRNKNLAWYTNGNIVIGNALTMALAFRLTGNTKYSTAYQTALTFAVSPPQGRWPGRGLIYTVRGARADGLDSKGYFTEEGYGRVGFDAEYTQVQLDHLATLYMVTNDSRVRTYLNVLHNQLDSRVNKATWLLDTSGGTRHPMMGRTFPYDTGSLSVLANLGGRTALRSHLAGQSAMYTKGFASGEGDRLRAAFGWTTATVIMSQVGNARLR